MSILMVFAPTTRLSCALAMEVYCELRRFPASHALDGHVLESNEFEVLHLGLLAAFPGVEEACHVTASRRHLLLHGSENPAIDAWLMEEAAKLGLWIYDGELLLAATYSAIEPRSPEDLRGGQGASPHPPLEDARSRHLAFVRPVLEAHGFSRHPAQPHWFVRSEGVTEISLGFSIVTDKNLGGPFAGRARATLMIGNAEVRDALASVGVTVGRLLRSEAHSLMHRLEREGGLGPWMRLPAGWSLCHDRCIDLDGAAFARDAETLLRPLWERFGTLAGLDAFFNDKLEPRLVEYRARSLPAAQDGMTAVRICFVGAVLAIRSGREDRSCLDIYRAHLEKSASSTTRDSLIRKLDTLIDQEIAARRRRVVKSLT